MPLKPLLNSKTARATYIGVRADLKGKKATIKYNNGSLAHVKFDDTAVAPDWFPMPKEDWEIEDASTTQS